MGRYYTIVTGQLFSFKDRLKDQGISCSWWCLWFSCGFVGTSTSRFWKTNHLRFQCDLQNGLLNCEVEDVWKRRQKDPMPLKPRWDGLLKNFLNVSSWDQRCLSSHRSGITSHHDDVPTSVMCFIAWNVETNLNLDHPLMHSFWTPGRQFAQFGPPHLWGFKWDKDVVMTSP